jgi:hypothetical protein
MHGMATLFGHAVAIRATKSVRFETKILNSVRFGNSFKKVLEIKKIHSYQVRNYWETRLVGKGG